MQIPVRPHHSMDARRVNGLMHMGAQSSSDVAAGAVPLHFFLFLPVALFHQSFKHASIF